MTVCNAMRVYMAVLSIIAAAGCTAEKDRLDEEVRRLCALDGGVKVYEQVALTKDLLDNDGRPRIPHEKEAKATDPYFYRWRTEYIRKGNPEMRRDHFTVIRRSDGKILGESISYARRGGDLPGPWHPSSYRCPKDASVFNAVFPTSSQQVSR